MTGSQNVAPAEVFDDNVDGWLAWQSSPWGRLRYRIVARTLATTMEMLGPRCRILDVGGGDGLDTVPLAAQGHHVTVLDQSGQLLQKATEHASSLGVSPALTTVLGDVGELADARFRNEHGPFDLVVCHNVLQYLDDVAAPIRHMVLATRPGGCLSVLSPNPAMDVLARAIRQTDPARAYELLDAPTVTSVTFGHEMTRLEAADVEDLLVAEGCAVTNRFGIRCVTDLIADEELKTDPVFAIDLERLEIELAHREPYLRTARYWQLIARVPPDDATDGARR